MFLCFTYIYFYSIFPFYLMDCSRGVSMLTQPLRANKLGNHLAVWERIILCVCLSTCSSCGTYIGPATIFFQCLSLLYTFYKALLNNRIFSCLYSKIYFFFFFYCSCFLNTKKPFPMPTSNYLSKYSV